MASDPTPPRRPGSRRGSSGAEVPPQTGQGPVTGTAFPGEPPEPEPTVPPREPKQRTPADRKLQAALADMYKMAGGAIGQLGDGMDDNGLRGTGMVMFSQADEVSAAWMDLADRNARVKAAIKSFLEASAGGVVVAMHVGMFMPLIIDRGWMPWLMDRAFTGTAEPGGNGDGPSVPLS